MFELTSSFSSSHLRVFFASVNPGPYFHWYLNFTEVSISLN